MAARLSIPSCLARFALGLYCAGLLGCGAAKPTNVKSFDYDCKPNGQTYTATATGKGDSRAYGFVFTINEQNVRATTATKAGWESAAMANCWVSRKKSC